MLYLTSVIFRATMFGIDDYWRTPNAHLTCARWAFLATVYWLPSYLDVFAMGMALALLSVWVARASIVCPPRSTWWPGTRVCSCLAAALTYVIVSFGIGLPRDLSILSPQQSFTRQLLYGLTALFLVVPAVVGGASPRGLPRRFLLWRPVAFVGLVSYGVYLWHQAWIRQVGIWIDYRLFQPDGSVVVATPRQFVVILVGGLAFALATAAISYFFVERPLLRWKDPRSLPRRQPDQAPVGV